MYPRYAYKHRLFPRWLWTLDIYYISRFLNIKPLFILTYSWQKFIYRWAYKRAIVKYPMIREEILSCADWDEYLEGL